MKRSRKNGKRKKGLARTLRSLKWKFYLFYTLPIGIITVGHAVLAEYGKLKALQAAREAGKSSP